MTTKQMPLMAPVVQDEKSLTNGEEDVWNDAKDKKKTKTRKKKTTPMQIPLMAPLVQEEVSSTCESAVADRTETLLAFTPLVDSLDCTDINPLRETHLHSVANTHTGTQTHIHAHTLPDTAALTHRPQHRQTCSTAGFPHVVVSTGAKHGKVCRYVPLDTVTGLMGD